MRCSMATVEITRQLFEQLLLACDNDMSPNLRMSSGARVWLMMGFLIKTGAGSPLPRPYHEG